MRQKSRVEKYPGRIEKYPGPKINHFFFFSQVSTATQTNQLSHSVTLLLLFNPFTSLEQF